MREYMDEMHQANPAAQDGQAWYDEPGVPRAESGHWAVHPAQSGLWCDPAAGGALFQAEHVREAESVVRNCVRPWQARRR